MQRNNKHYFAARAKKALLRLKSGKGSVLFFIVALMTVLVVIASAVYYAVTSSKQQITVKYESEQAYQSALAVNDIITEYINTRTEDPFVDAILGLNKDETLTTTGSDGTGFSELAGGLGDYKITVKKIKGSGTDDLQTIQIETEVELDGEKSVVTTIGEFRLTSKPYSFDRFFTSTGYAPNDVIMSGMNVTSTMYLDNEYSQIGTTQGSNSFINIKAEIICAGTLSLNNVPINSTGDKSFDITVGNNLYMTYGNAGGGGGQGQMNLNGGRIRVGGNLIQGYSFRNTNDTDVYVVGDYIGGGFGSATEDSSIYVNGDAAFSSEEYYKGMVYVNGDVFLDESTKGTYKFSKGLVVGGNIYIEKSTLSEQQKNNFINAGFDENRIKIYDDKDGTISFSVATQELCYDKLRTNMNKALASVKDATSEYTYVWPSDAYVCESLQNVKAKINDKLGNPEYSNWNMTKKFVNEDGTYVYQPINFSFDGSKTPESVDARFAGSGSNANQMIIKAEQFGEYVIMGDIRVTNQTWTGYNIVFDTTMPDGKDKDMYVYLPANCYMEKIPAANEWSSPTYSFSNAASDSDKFNCFRWNNEPSGAFEGWFSVLVKGKGSVIFVVPDKVTYFAQRRLFMGHYNLMKEISPSSIISDGAVRDYGCFANQGAETEAKIENIMYEKSISYEGKERHYNGLIFKDDIINKYLTSGAIHNNIFIVAIEKNSSANFDAQYNTFCGFMYAPYMTFEAGKDTSTSFAMFGGLIVSDYTMGTTTRTFMATLPYDYYDRFVDSSLTNPFEIENARREYMEKLISNSGGDIGSLGSSGSRTWRKYGYN